MSEQVMLTTASEEQRRRTGAVHVVTVTHNSTSTLVDYFAGLARCRDSIAGVTVVDNGSSDDTVARARELARHFDMVVEIIENENTGFAGGYHAASASALPRDLPVLCLNPDVVLSEGAVESMLEVILDFPDAAVVTVPLVESDGTPDTASRRRLPTLGASMLYSVLGRLTPSFLRYNSREGDAPPTRSTRGGIPVSLLEATTGAVMLVPTDFRRLDEGVFDRDYWMYGEDLQLCADAAAAGRSVMMAEGPPSVHVKGVSSGRPRSRRSNRAFHDAMTLYAAKNLVRNPLSIAFVRIGVEVHFHLSELRAAPHRRKRARAAQGRAIEPMCRADAS